MGVSYLEVIDRMKWAGRLKNDSAVARALDITPQALSNYKKRGEMPSNLIIEFSERFGISIDWLVIGTGEVYRRGAAAAEEGAAYSGKAESIDPEEVIHRQAPQGDKGRGQVPFLHHKERHRLRTFRDGTLGCEGRLRKFNGLLAVRKRRPHARPPFSVVGEGNCASARVQIMNKPLDLTRPPMLLFIS